MKILKRLAARNENPQTNAPVLIACLGDSVTHGCFELEMKGMSAFTSTCRPWEGYVAQLQLRLAQLYPLAAPTVLNAGVGGDSAEQMARRLERDVLAFHPALVILEVGLNDCMGSDTKEDAKAFAQRVGGMLDAILSSGAEAMLLTPNAMCARMGERVPAEGILREAALKGIACQCEGRLSAFVEAARGQAVRRGVPIADAYARWEKMREQGVDITALLVNGINHPSSEMHALFAEEIVRAMQMN